MRFWHSSHTAICGKYTSPTTFCQVSDLDEGYEISAFIPYCHMRHSRIQSSQRARNTVIGLIKWLRPKGLKVGSYAEKCA